MNNEEPLKSRVSIAIFITAMVMLGVTVGVVITGAIFYEEEGTTYQAMLNISNWTNRTLNVTVYVFGNSWDTLQFTLDHTHNVTITVTWQDVKETVTFIHCVAPDIYNTVAYSLEPGQYRSVMLI